MDTFRQPTPEEAKFLALQFMGQNLGEIKELDKNIIGKTNTLKGNILDINNILNSIPTKQQQNVPQNTPQSAPPVGLQPRPVQAPIAAPVALPVATAPAMNLDPLIEVLNKINSNLEKAVNLLDK